MDVSTFGVARILANAIPGSAAKRAEDAAAAAESAAELLQPPATDSDVGKALIAKTVEDGKVTEYEYGEAGGGTVTDVQVNGTSVVQDGVADIDTDDLGIAQTVTNWLDQHVDPDTGYVIDDTLSIAGAAADAKAVGDDVGTLRDDVSVLDNAMGKSMDDLAMSKTENYSLYVQANKLYTIYNADYRYYSGAIVAGKQYVVKGEISGYRVFFGTGTGETVPAAGQIGNVNDTDAHIYTAPSDTTKIFIAGTKTNSFTVKDVSTTHYTVADDTYKNTESIAKINNALKKTYMKDHPIKALFPEFVSFFWCSNVMPNAFNSKEVVMTVSGSLGDKYLTVSDISPNTITIADVDRWTGFVLTEDGVAYTVHNCKYDSTEEKLEIYPPLTKTITNATLASLYYDGGGTYVGLHLTTDGYRAYMYHLYNQNPKHCEIGLYNESFDSRTKTYSDSYPFSKISGSPLFIEHSAFTQYDRYLVNFFPMCLKAIFSSSYTPYNSKNGLKWEVNLNGTSGYLELLMGIRADTLKLPEGQEVYVDVYIDDVLVSTTVFTDVIGKRICVDYENAKKGYIEIYANKFDTINGDGWSICVNKCTWWINELQYEENAKMFPRGVFVAQEFDSWGVFHQGASGTALHNLINADAGVVVDYENHSKGSQTTAWGTSWWYENVRKYNPTMAITDFVINDTNSVAATGLPDTIEGPDGTEYNNKITSDMFVANTKKLEDYAVNNGIQPLIMRNFQHSYYNFIDAAIEALSIQYWPNTP